MRSNGFAATAALLLSLCAGVVPPDETKAVRRFKAVIRSQPTSEFVDEKREALAALADFDSAAVANVLVDGYVRLERESEPLRAERRERLFKGGGSSMLKRTRNDLQPLRDLQDAIAARLRKLRARESVHALVNRLIRADKKLPLTLQLELASRTGELRDGDFEFVIGATDSVKGKQGVLVLLRALAPLGRRAEKAGAWVLEQLEHQDETVRRQAFRTLAQLAWPGGIEPLVARIDAEDDALREDVLDALVVLTGQHPGNSALAWKMWLQKEGAPYLRGEVRLGRGDASKRQRRKDQNTTTGQYFGLDQSGRAILYVFDVSKSMQAPMSGQRRDGSRPETGVERRWDRCRKELIAAIDKLTEDKTFNLIGFANFLQVFSPTMLKATAKNKKRARQWVERLDLELETNIHDALELSFYMAGRGAKDRYYEPEVDTVFFLSDGAPTRPSDGTTRRRMQPDSQPQILSAVGRWNALGRITVHTIGIGLRGNQQGRRPRPGGRGGNGQQRGPRYFMEQLATQNFGKFVTPR